MGNKNLSKDEYLAQAKKNSASILEETTAPQGYAGSTKEESVPNYFKHGAERQIKGFNNCFVILGRDREGYFGGKGFEPHPRSGAIDIVAGVASCDTKGIQDEKFYPPSFFRDGARLYLSQRSDVDNYFGLAKGSSNMVNNKSCAILKADHTRMVARESVKIIAGKGKINAKDGEKNSLGGLIRGHGTIDLIAGNNDEDLQSLVKGENLIKFLKALILEIGALNTHVFQNQMMISSVASNLIFHIHPGPGTPSVQLVPTLTHEVVQSFARSQTTSAIRANLEVMDKITFLNPLHQDYINSKLVKTT